MKKIIRTTLGCAITAILSFNASAAVVVFNDRAAFQNYVGTYTLDTLDTSASGSGLDLSNADYSWTMSDYACTNSNGCGYGVTNPFVNGTNDWVWTYGSGTFNFNFEITAFGLDYVNPYNAVQGQVSLNGLTDGLRPNGSFFGIATDDGSSLGNFIIYGQFTAYQGFDNVTYSTSTSSRQNDGQIPEPASLFLLGLGLTGLGLIRRKRKVA